MHWISPRAKAGFRMFAASRLPGAEPAPIIVWISSMKSIISLCARNSLIKRCRRSSNCPRYCVPATMLAISKDTMRLCCKIRGTLPEIIKLASPSTTALFPTPGSPMRMGLFFLRRLRICAMRCISFSRPMTGSRASSAANFVRSVPKLSITGVSLVCLSRVFVSLCL